MKLKISFVLLFTLSIVIRSNAQSYYDDFETYTVGNYLGNSSSVWTTWSGAPGTSEDVKIDTNESFSGINSLYFESQFGNGPQDVVLPFGGRHTSGHFRFTSKWLISNKTGAYFNFQGGATIGSSWAMDVYMYDDGTIDVGGYLYSNYPQGRWFELVVDIDLDQNVWDVIIDGNSIGTFANFTNSVSYLDIYPLFSGGSFWVDDVGYCLNNACLPDISMDLFSINPDPLCSNKYGDVNLTVTNNGPESAKQFVLGLQMAGQPIQNRIIELNGLPKGKDTSFVVSGLFKTNISGIDLEVKAINIGGDRNISNDTISYKVDVTPSPSGSEYITGTTFQGIRNSVPSGEDYLEVGKTNEYEITPPTFSNNAGYPSLWNINGISMVTSGGTLLPGTSYQFTLPGTNSNAKIAVTGNSTYLDSVLIIRISIRKSASGCDTVIEQKIRIVPTPKINFSFPSSICKGDNVNFVNLSTIHSGTTTFKWYFGDGDSSDVNDPVHQYQNSGSFNIRLVGTSQPYLIVADTILTIQVNEIPIALFKAHNKCDGVDIPFENLSTISNGALITYEWDFGDGSPINTQTDPFHRYANMGTYKVKLTATSNGCATIFERTAIAFATPTANFTAPSSSICTDSEIEFFNSSQISYGELGYYWDFGDGNGYTLENGIHAYKNSGTYQVKLLVVSEFDCRDSITSIVNIKPGPHPDFTTDLLCSKSSTNFINTTVETIPNPSYHWTFSDNTTSTFKNVKKTWLSDGPITATLKAEFSNGCSSETSKEMNILNQPNAKFEVNDVCHGETSIFVNKSDGDNNGIVYQWDFGDGNGSSLQNPTYVYNITTTTSFNIELIATYPGACSDTANKLITVSESPICDFSYDELGLLKTKFIPTNTTYSKYEWFFGEGGTSTDVTPSYQYLYSGNFYVTMKATNNAGCDCEVTKRIGATTSVNSLDAMNGIKIYPNPNTGLFNISNDAQKEMSVEIYNTIGELIYSGNSTEGLLTIDLTDKSSGIYQVKIIIDGLHYQMKLNINN